jgi:glycine/D-amino acid oxidase-like deaminating enzyme
VSAATTTCPTTESRRDTPSYWLDRLGPLDPRPCLEGTQEADVCIVGAGFTGLWTAYELKRSDPRLEVAVLESQFAGFGASGRNGGWVLGHLAGPPERWIRWGGRDGARALELAIAATVDEIGAAVAREEIACDFHKGGNLTVARSVPQLRRLRQIIERDRRLAIGRENHQWLTAEQVRARMAIDGACGGVFMGQCARVQPAKLVRGLAEAVERTGVRLYEHSPVRRIAPGRAETDRGRVLARYVVRATEGYTAGLPGLRRSLLPMNSSMIITEALTDEQWSQIGWRAAETMYDAAHVYVYLQRTADGRVAIGGRGVPYRFGSRTDREGPVPARTVAQLRERLGGLFPALRAVGVADAWAGVFGVARDWMPRVGIDRETGLAWAGGYVGEGVAAANLAARTLRDLLLGRDSELTRLPWVQPPAHRWAPEPLRFAGARSIYGLYRLADRLEARTERPSAVATVADMIAGR